MKKLSAIIICLLMLFTCNLAGCATFSINKVKYYNEVLAKVGDTNITRFEVLSAYNSYGNSYYVQQMSQSESEAIRSTLDLLADRESLYQYGKTDAKFKPTASQVNALIEQMFTSLDEEMVEYIATAKNILNIKSTKTEEEASDETAYKYQDYVYATNRRATLESKTTYYTTADKTTVASEPTEFFDVEYYISYILPEEETYNALINEDYLNDFEKDGIIDAIREAYDVRLKETIKEDNPTNETAIYNKVIDLFVADLIEYEHYLRDSKGNAYNKVEKDLINRYFERTFNTQIKSQYLTNIRTNYLENETLSINELMEKFDSLITSSHAQYVNRPATYKAKMKDIGTDGDTVLYHPTLSDGTEFGYFIHTLLSFSEDQKTAIKNLDEDDADYAEDYASIISSTEVAVRNSEGVEEGTAKFSDIVKEYQEITKIADYKSKMETFIQFMFKYTGDTATLSSGMPYVVGTNGNSSMVEAFTNEAVELMETDVLGAMSEVDLDDIGSFCITEYGIHFIFYVNEVDAYDVAYAEKDMVTINDLYNKVINPLTGETYFDMLFDVVYPASSDEEVYTSNTGYSAYEAQLVEDMQAVNKYVPNETKIKGTKPNI